MTAVNRTVPAAPVQRLLSLAAHPELPEGRAMADLLLAWWHGGVFGLFNLQRLNAFAPDVRHAVTDFLSLADYATPDSLGIVAELEAIARRRLDARATLH